MADKKFIGRVFMAKWALAKLVLKREDINKLVTELKETGKEEVAILCKESQQGKLYAEIDTFQPTAQPQQTKQQASYQAMAPSKNYNDIPPSDAVDDLPF